MSQSELILAAIARQESIISKAEAEIEKLNGQLRDRWWEIERLKDLNKHLSAELDKALPRIPLYFPKSWASQAEVSSFYSEIKLFVPAYAMSLPIAGRWKGFGIKMMVDRFIEQYIPAVRASLEKSLCVSVST